jgi:multiple sugar transport system permease protein
MWNTVYITVLGLIGNVISSSMAAYAFARLEWKFRDTLFAILLGTIMLPPQVTMIPVYIIFSKIGWVNTLRPLWVPAFFGNAFYIFLLRQFFLTVPRDLEEAAKIDGCSFLRIYWQILLPVIKPALATIAIFSFISHWNNFLGPLIYINDVDKMPISLGLRLFQQSYGGEWSLMMAASTLATIPIIVVFFLFQKQFIEGIVMTGMKG